MGFFQLSETWLVAAVPDAFVTGLMGGAETVTCGYWAYVKRFGNPPFVRRKQYVAFSVELESASMSNSVSMNESLGTKIAATVLVVIFTPAFATMNVWFASTTPPVDVAMSVVFCPSVR